ncbi:MAG TPA: tautomerase family protein [Burkholderiaceae bacterium]|nr:tautomerase family protein [Burkholderiaceae bacterium]
MPYVTISITPGFSAAQKKQLMQRTSDAVVQSIGAPVASIRILLHELQEGCYLNAASSIRRG